MSSLRKKTKLNDTPQVLLDGYKGHEDVPKNVTHVRFHPSVVEVDDDAFEDRKQLIEVILNDGLKEIGDYAFNGCALQSINIPSTVTNIGMNSFSSCTGLRKVVLNDGLIEIGTDAFTSCKTLESITIPSTVLEIGSEAFVQCENMREVELNEGLQTIGDRAFQ